MKRIVSLIAILAIVYSCNDRLSVDIQKDDLIPVKLSLAGEVVVDEEPLTKVASSNDLIGIQVYQDNAPYAYGVFEDANNLTINLHSERNYSFQVTYIKDGKDKLTLLNQNFGNPYTVYTYYGSSSTVPNSNLYYWELSSSPLAPGTIYYKSYSHDNDLFRKYSNTIFDFSTSGYFIITPGDYYGDRDYYLTLGRVYFSGSSGPTYKGYILSDKLYYVQRSVGITNSFVYDGFSHININSAASLISNAINVDRYYGEGSFLSVRGNGNAVTINMKHLVYSIQCNVTGVSDGTASITIKRDNTVLLNKTDISGEYHSDELYFTCSDWSGAWQYSDNYTENITVSMTWLRGVGVTQDLGSQIVQVKRNCRNVINISLSTSLSSPSINVKQDE